MKTSYSSILREEIARGTYTQAVLEPLLASIRAEHFLGTSRLNHVEPDWRNREALGAYFAELLVEVENVEKADLLYDQQARLRGI
jgi:hypothetical protein